MGKQLQKKDNYMSRVKEGMLSRVSYQVGGRGLSHYIYIMVYIPASWDFFLTNFIVGLGGLLLQMKVVPNLYINWMYFEQIVTKNTRAI